MVSLLVLAWGWFVLGLGLVSAPLVVVLFLEPVAVVRDQHRLDPVGEETVVEGLGFLA